jgi:hypothetical protein
MPSPASPPTAQLKSAAMCYEQGSGGLIKRLLEGATEAFLDVHIFIREYCRFKRCIRLGMEYYWTFV